MRSYIVPLYTNGEAIDGSENIRAPYSTDCAASSAWTNSLCRRRKRTLVIALISNLARLLRYALLFVVKSLCYIAN
jgi:hypothetical protein